MGFHGTSTNMNECERLNFAYKIAQDEAAIQSAISKTYYDHKIRESMLEVGDRVLVRNVIIQISYFQTH